MQIKNKDKAPTWFVLQAKWGGPFKPKWLLLVFSVASAGLSKLGGLSGINAPNKSARKGHGLKTS